MMRKYFFSVLLFVFLSIFYTRCTTDKFDVDVSNVPIDVEYYRMDEDIFHHQNEDINQWKNEISSKYKGFYRVFVEKIIRVGNADSLKTMEALKGFTQDALVSSIQKHIEKTFPEEVLEPISDQLADGFKHYRYYFPKANIPNVVFYNSGFNYGIVTLDDYVGVGLDFYLGKKDSLVNQMPGDVFHQYEKDKMDKKYLVRDVFDGWLKNNLDSLKDNKNLLRILVNEGKRMYVLNALLPSQTEENLMRYTKQELEWTKKNKKRIWRELAKQKVIYGTKNFDNQKWITEGPFTNVGAIPDDSPARLGVWLGWQMVKNYMEENPQFDIDDLLKDKNYQTILNAYKP